VLIKHCASQFFLMPLDGATILLLDFIHAATGIITVSAGQTQVRIPSIPSANLLCFYTAIEYHAMGISIAPFNYP